VGVGVLGVVAAGGLVAEVGVVAGVVLVAGVVAGAVGVVAAVVVATGGGAWAVDVVELATLDSLPPPQPAINAPPASATASQVAAFGLIDLSMVGRDARLPLLQRIGAVRTVNATRARHIWLHEHGQLAQREARADHPGPVDERAAVVDELAVDGCPQQLHVE